ncbi:4-diphosphocytidyl-2-methyl-D-erithritol synthase [Thermoplasmatales archaeon BRNA1]|nr:4-diphosphocytidyl-2-methyl-D-erithritol synthase [Thermoplasmatales archaeon BRNA1]
MITAILLAGGIGKRVGDPTPKQFLEIKGKPIIAYALDYFQNNQYVDRIAVVCLHTWEERLSEIKEKYNYTKLTHVIPGGKNGMESTYNGLRGIADVMHEDDMVIIHDAVRPLISEDIVDDCIYICKKHGNACSSVAMQETIVRTNDGISGNVNIDRSDVMRVQTPQAYRYGDILSKYEQAYKQGITDSVYANTLYMEMGGRIFFSRGSVYNLKVTMLEDLDYIRLMLEFNDIHKKKIPPA